MSRIVIYFLITLSFLFGETDSPQDFKNSIIAMIKAELSQKVSFHDFDIDLDHWINQWMSEKNENEDIQIEKVYVSPQQNRFHVELTGFKKPKKLFGKIRFFAEIPVLNRLIQAGEEIQKEDLTIHRTQLDQIQNQYLTHEDEIIGKTPRHSSLKPGMPLFKNQLKAPIIVKKGHVMEIAFERRSLRISNKGIALKDATKDENIPFEIHTQDPKQPKKIIYASVVSANSAKINL